MMSAGNDDQVLTRIEELRKLVRESNATPNQVSKALAQVFNVRSTEVGLLYRHEYFLKFLYPVELQAAGSIPLSGSAVAARTATTKKADVFNNFTRVPHRSIFETIKLRDREIPLPIQKLMSAPILGPNGDVVGVVQISRKGDTPREAGPDFTREDAEKLVQASQIIAPYMAKLYRPEPVAVENQVTLKVQAERTAPVLPATAAS